MRIGHKPRPHTRLILSGMGERTLAMLRLLLQGPDWKDCAVVGAGEADLALVDLDTPTPDRDWEAFRRRHPDLPAIVMSLREQQRDNARHLRKPFDADALRRAIDQARAKPAPARQRAPAVVPPAVATTPPPAAPAVTGPAAANAATAKGPDTRKAADAFDQATDERNCGHRADVDLDSPRSVAKALYDPPRHFQGMLEHALRQVRDTGVPLAIRGLPAPFVVVPGRVPTIVTPLKDSVLRSVCVMAVEPGTLAIERAPSSLPDGTAVRADVLVWQVALWTARGRLRRGVALDTPVRLARWPDFTRQVETRHAMRLAALLVRAPRTPRELCAAGSVPQRYVMSFLSAAASVGLLVRQAPAAPVLPFPARPPAPRGLFARILGRLVNAA
ncbi:MAG: hypothetical protein U1F10_13790 [Burkholderiales bacterium]